jgi:hypothetical protein
MIIITYSKEELEEKYGKVWDTTKLQEDFEVLGFLAPHIACKRKSDGVKGSMEFQTNPRLYYDFQRSDGKEETKTIGEVLGLKNATKEEIGEWVIKWAERNFPKQIAEKEIEKYREYNRKKKECDECAGNNHPMGDYCSGCEMKEYRRNKS